MISLISQINKAIPVSVKARILYRVSSPRDSDLERLSGKPKIIVALAADYGNLGDIAITYAQTKFLEACLPDRTVVDFPISSTFTRLKALKRIVAEDDLVTIVGGGNMGDLHHSIEDCRRFVIDHFPRNRIVSFPQTIDFSATRHGRRELKKTMSSYGRHRDLHLFARERVSFEIMKDLFPDNRIYLAPDIVLSVRRPQTEQERRGIMLCIRGDNESSFPAEKREAFMREISSSFPELYQKDTHIGGSRLTLPEREGALLGLWDFMQGVAVVVTDRLHGMIFAAITGTPCVVLQSSNHKIRATYDAWLRPLGHIRFQETLDADETLRHVRELLETGGSPHPLLDLAAQFGPLREVVTGQ